MSVRRIVLGAVLGAAAILLGAPLPGSKAGLIPPRVVGSLHASGSELLGGQLHNLRFEGGALSIADHVALGRDERPRGMLVSPIEAAPEAFNLVSATVVLEDAASGRIELDARSSVDGERWSVWEPLPANGGYAALPAGRYLQYRVELIADGAAAPRLRALTFDLASTGAALVASGEQDEKGHPTVRLFASREGLIGRKTANGHTIGEKDRFAALPSKRVLNPDGRRDYQVRVTYRGKSVTLPIWDVGPWNTRDNFWDADRELFGDLPRFVPQAYAAWKDNYNGGRDQFNRWVSFPTAIDIADGAFIDDLGMRSSDWVDVTFLWLDGPSPPRLETPPVTGLKPEPKPTVTREAADGHAWYFADGSTAPPFETWLVLFNPNDEDARATVSYLKTDGGVERQDVVLNGESRVAIYLNQFLPAAEFGILVDANHPIAAERSVYFGRDGYSTAGTPAPSTTWYLAEGSSQPPFDTWILLQNPGQLPARATLTFMTAAGEQQVYPVDLPPTSRRSVYANEIVPQAAFSTLITADQPIVAERTMYLANGGAHGSLAAAQTAKTWYLAEGSTLDGFDTWLLIQNPGREAARVKVTLLRERGEPVEQELRIGARSRAAVNARQLAPRERFGAKVEADQPVVVERSMYFGGAPDGQGTGASSSLGAPELARTWLLPDGSTREPFDEQLLIANPGSARAQVQAEFVDDNGRVTRRSYEVPARGRLTVDVNAEVPDASLSIRVTADQPVVVERSSYFNGGAGGTSSLGIPR